jgi:hypothetical protein
MERKNPTLYDVIFAAIMLIALALRVVFASQWHLSEKEAAFVLSASAEPETIYQVWMNFLFTFFKDSEFFARVLAILSGTLLVALPLLLRKYLGDSVSIILAAGLALDPGLVALSKQAGPEIFAISALLAFLIFLYEKKWIFAGVFLAIGLLSGYQFWIGAIAFFLCTGFSMVFQTKSEEDNSPDEVVQLLQSMFSNINWKVMISSFGVTLLVGGTLFFTQPAALAGIGSGLIDFFVRENPGFYSIPISALMIGLLTAYGSLFVFGIIGSWKISPAQRSFIWQWVFIVFILVTVFPDHQLADYIWMVLPLYYPAAKYFSSLSFKSQENQLFVFGGSIALMMLLLFSLYSLKSYLEEAANPLMETPHLEFLFSSIAGFVILCLVILIIAWGWSSLLSTDLMIYMLLSGLLVVYFIPCMRSAGFGAKPENLMWIRSSYFADADLFDKTITSLEQNRLEKDDSLRIQLQGIETNSLLWELRQYDVFIKSVDYLEDDLNPDVIITSIDSPPQVSENRMGQDLIVDRTAAWSLMTNMEYLDWALYQKPHYNNAECIVWADLYEGSLEVVDDPLPDVGPITQ